MSLRERLKAKEPDTRDSSIKKTMTDLRADPERSRNLGDSARLRNETQNARAAECVSDAIANRFRKMRGQRVKENVVPHPSSKLQDNVCSESRTHTKDAENTEKRIKPPEHSQRSLRSRQRCDEPKADFHGPTSSEKLAQDVHKLYFDERLSMKEAAEGLGFKSVGIIQRIFSEEGWEPRSAGPQRREVDPEKVRKLYFKDQQTIREVASTLGVSKDVIFKIFRAQGWQTRREAASRREIDYDEVRRLYFEEGLTKEESAKKLGVSEWALRGVFREMNWSARTRHFETEEERHQALREHRQRGRDKVRDLRETLFGKECRICGKEEGLAIHRKDGTWHDDRELWSLRHLRSLDPNDWAALCIPCHQGAHFMFDYAECNWDKLEALAKDRVKSAGNALQPFELPSNDVPSSRRYLELKAECRGDSESLRFALFGGTCHFCGIDHEDTRIVIHRKDGRKHPYDLTEKEKYFRTLEPDEWVSLCQKHHLRAHWVMDVLGLKWKDIESVSHTDSAKDTSSARYRS